VRRLAEDRLVATAQDAYEQEHAEVAPKALFQRWEMLREWMRANRRFRLWQESLHMLACQWQESGSDGDTLLRGAPLVEAQD